jgi:hypothetical protein
MDRRTFLTWSAALGSCLGGGVIAWLSGRNSSNKGLQPPGGMETQNLPPVRPLSPHEVVFDPSAFESTFLLPNDAEILLGREAEFKRGGIHRWPDLPDQDGFPYLSSSPSGDCFFSAEGGHELLTEIVARTSGTAQSVTLPAGSKFLPDGRLAHAEGTTIRYFDTRGAETTRKALPLGPGAPASLALSPDGRWLAMLDAAPNKGMRWLVFDCQEQCFRACLY